MKISWVFDLISPYSYLGLTQLPRLPAGTEVELVPALFGVVLNHHGQIGPAEIDSKRRLTHPFNPLSAMRLVIAAGSDRRSVQTAFDFVFGQGRDVSDPVVLAELAHALGLPDLDSALNDPAVKQTLRKNTEWAIQRGVFGVPTFVVGNELFWGQDAFDMVVDYLRDPAGFEDAEMRRIDTLPVGVTRTRVTRP
jgi:2-hydroxychromene-2-carboxylate isomerase